MKIIITYLLLFLCSSAYSQLDFELGPVPAYAEGMADGEDFTAHTMLKNLSGETIVFGWERITNDIPAGWESYICSAITCAPPDVSWGTFSLTALDSTNLDVYFRPEGISGNGMVELRLFLTDDTTQVIYATYFGNASPVSTFQPILDQVKIYPCPAKDHISIENDGAVRIELFSYQGILIALFDAVTDIDISMLLSGNYFLKIYDQDKKLISVNSFQKLSTQ